MSNRVTLVERTSGPAAMPTSLMWAAGAASWHESSLAPVPPIRDQPDRLSLLQRTSENIYSTTFVNKAQKERRRPVGPRPLLIWLSRLGRATSAPPRLDRLGGQLSNNWGRSLVWRNDTFPVLSVQGKGRGSRKKPRPLFGTRYARAKLPRLRFGPNLTA